jgi:hypothetical protein
MIVGSRVMAKEDNAGNTLYLRVWSDENKVDVGGSIFLKLKSESKKRNLGNLIVSDRSFHIIRDSGRHYHYKSKSYGFNWNIINDADLGIKTIHLIVDKKDKYIIPKSVLETYGRFLNFKQQGFELQKFLPMDMIRQFRDEKFNAETDLQNENDD